MSPAARTSNPCGCRRTLLSSRRCSRHLLLLRSRPLPNSFDELKSFPKIELHLHVEGSIREQTATELARVHDPQSPFARDGWSRDYWRGTTLAGFLAEFRKMTRACI